MAGTDRDPTHRLAELLQAMKDKPFSFGFYQAMRLFECFYPDKPRIGTSRRPADDPIRLGQEPAMTFESASLTAFEKGQEGKPHRLKERFLGLLGPNGPLPLHLNEYAYRQEMPRQRSDYAQERQGEDRIPTFADFLDIFHHRILSLFYRAWANKEPTVSFDRPDSDRFGDYVASFEGLGMSALRHRDEISDLTKLHFCGRLACQTKCPEGLEALLAGYFNLPVSIEENVGEWLDLPAGQVCRLGKDPGNGTLGRSVIVGRTVWICQHKFRIRLGPLSYEDYQSMLPGGKRIRHLVALVRNYIGDELAWDVKLVLKREEVPAVRLSDAFRLGWTTWLGKRPWETDADDLALNAFAFVNKSPGGKAK